MDLGRLNDGPDTCSLTRRQQQLAEQSTVASLPTHGSAAWCGTAGRRYTLLTTHTVECVFLLETMHGITFALSYSSSVEYSRKLAPHQWVAFMQSLLYVVFFCLGPGVASLVGGFVMQVRMKPTIGPTILSWFVCFSRIATLCCSHQPNRSREGGGQLLLDASAYTLSVATTASSYTSVATTASSDARVMTVCSSLPYCKSPSRPRPGARERNLRHMRKHTTRISRATATRVGLCHQVDSSSRLS
jgi:hypothetical protein